METAAILLIVGILIATFGILYTMTNGMLIWKGKVYIPMGISLPFRTKLWALYTTAFGFGIIGYDALKYGSLATQVAVAPFLAIALYVALEATAYYLRFMYINYSMFFFGKWEKYKHTSDRAAAAKGLLLARKVYTLRLMSAYKFGFWLSRIGVFPKSPVDDISDEEVSKMIEELFHPISRRELEEKAKTDEEYKKIWEELRKREIEEYKKEYEKLKKDREGK